MALYVTALNALLDTLGATPLITHCSAHTAAISNPTSPNEVTGGSPAYARKTISFAAASSSSMSSDGTDPVLDIPTGTTVTTIGFWNHATNQTVAAFMGQITLSSAAVFASQGTLTLTSVTWSAS